MLEMGTADARAVNIVGAIHVYVQRVQRRVGLGRPIASVVVVAAVLLVPLNNKKQKV